MTNHFSVKKRPARLRMGAASLVLFCICVLFAGCTKEKAPSPERRQSEKVIPFTITTLDGSEFSLEAAKGSVVVLNFWASWCGPCKYEAPFLQKAYETFGPQGVKFIGVAVDDTGEGARAFVERFGLTFPIAIDSTGEILNAYNIYGIPRTYIIGKDGEAAYTHTGAITGDDLSREIRKAM